jgi:hypothetical protein
MSFGDAVILILVMAVAGWLLGQFLARDLAGDDDDDSF